MTPTSIRDLAEFVLDGTHGSPVRTSTGVPVLSAQNVKDGSLSYQTDRYTSATEYEQFRRRLPLKAGDLLLTIVGSIGRAAILADARPLVFQRSVAVVRPRPEAADSRFLYHATQTQSFQSQLLRSVNQSSQAGVYLGKLGAVLVPLPGLPEQKRIAEVLDRAEALRAQRRAALAQLDKLTQAIFLEMFGDPVTNPRAWQRKPVGHVGRVITGNTPSRSMPEYYGDAIEWIKSDNLNTPHYYLTPAQERLSDEGKAVARLAPMGSILVTCIAGSPGCIGNAALADREVAFNQQINALVPVQGNSHFLYAQLRVGKRLVQEASTAGMKGMVSKSRFERIQLMFPPVELQERFAQRVLAAEKLKDTQQASLTQLGTLFSSLQHRAFRGEL